MRLMREREREKSWNCHMYVVFFLFFLLVFRTPKKTISGEIHFQNVGAALISTVAFSLRLHYKGYLFLPEPSPFFFLIFILLFFKDFATSNILSSFHTHTHI